MHTVMLSGVHWEIRRLPLGLAITGAIFVELNFNGRLLEPLREMPHKTFDIGLYRNSIIEGKQLPFEITWW